MSTWKQQKEAFVSDHDGGSLIELIAVAAVVPLCCGARLRLHDAKDSTTIKLAKDAIVLVAPIAASLTIGADYMPAMFMVLAAVALATQKHWEPMQRVQTQTQVIGLFRACQAVFTGICILAVDFRAFPRRFCKTETYGYSLMDMGVGSFVVGNAMISRLVLARSWRPKRILPLVVLGLGRLITVKASGYPEHVTEYGVHWNAFFTLAVVDLCDGLGCYLKLGPGGCLGAAGALMVVSRVGIDAAYVLSDAPRDSLFAANREGLASAPGYAALFFAAAAFFDFFLARGQLRLSRLPRLDDFVVSDLSRLPSFANLILNGLLDGRRGHSAVHIACMSGAFLALAWLSGPPSRRVADAPFVLLCLGFNGWILTLCALFATKLQGVVLVVADAHLLYWFLAANVTTGVFNFATDSLKIPGFVAVVVLVAKTFADAFLVQTATAEMRLKES